MNFIYTNGEVTIRSIRREDTPDILRWRNQPQVRDNLYNNDEITADGHEYWLSHYVDTGKCHQFIIESCQPAPCPVGSVFLKNIDADQHKAEFGIFLGREAQGRGIGTAATCLILQHAFDTLQLERVYLTVFAQNPAAIRSYEKAGFMREGCARSDFWRDGQAYDIVLMGILKREWRQGA